MVVGEGVLRRGGKGRLVAEEAANELLRGAVLHAVRGVDEQTRNQILGDDAVQKVDHEDAARHANHAAFHVGALALRSGELIVDDL